MLVEKEKEKTKMICKYQYKIIEISRDETEEENFENDFLNFFGYSGWELVSIFQSYDGCIPAFDKLKFIFKRRFD